jgi:hypothetical protein
MKFLKSKKGVALVVALAVIGIASVGAYAYFSATGAGQGQGTVGSATAFVLHGTAAGNAYPGASQTVTFTVDNNGGGSEYLAKIHLVSADACSVAWTYPGGTPTCTGTTIGTCGGTNSALHDFQMADVTVNHEFAPGTGQSVTPTGSLVMNDLNASQDTCQGAYLNLNLTSS